MALTLRHVRARLEKRRVRCTDSRPGERTPCPGWRIVNDPRTQTRCLLVACSVCNATQPRESTIVTNAMVALLPEARDAVADATRMRRAAHRAERDVESRARLKHLREVETARRTLGRQSDVEALAAVRGMACVALDAVREGRCKTLEGAAEHEISTLLKFALLDHQTRFPRVSRGRRHWVFRAESRYPQQGTARCRYCGECLIADARLGLDYTGWAAIEDHVVPCALECLAGLREPVHPGAWRNKKS